MAQEAMEAAKRQIENRKKFLKNLSNKEIQKVANIQTLSKEGLDKAKRAAELQARISSAMARRTGNIGVGTGPQETYYRKAKMHFLEKQKRVVFQLS